jgi:hypothetical protein
MAVKEKRANHKQELHSMTPPLDSVNPPDDNSIEAHVARHLLKFESLREVWLGWKVHDVV